MWVLILVVMEYGLRLFINNPNNSKNSVLILVVMEYGLRRVVAGVADLILVLILVVMEYGLRL